MKRKKTIERSLEGKQNACVYVFFKSVENRWKVMLLKNAQSKGIENALHVSSDFVHTLSSTLFLSRLSRHFGFYLEFQSF